MRTWSVSMIKQWWWFLWHMPDNTVWHLLHLWYLSIIYLPFCQSAKFWLFPNVIILVVAISCINVHCGMIPCILKWHTVEANYFVSLWSWFQLLLYETHALCSNLLQYGVTMELNIRIMLYIYRSEVKASENEPVRQGAESQRKKLKKDGVLNKSYSNQRKVRRRRFIKENTVQSKEGPLELCWIYHTNQVHLFLDQNYLLLEFLLGGHFSIGCTWFMQSEYIVWM